MGASLVQNSVTPVAVNVTGLPATLSPLTVAVRVLGPASGPSTQPPTVAMPLALVTMTAAPLTLPPPDATANVTLAPPAILPKESLTMTAGGVSTDVPAPAD